MDGSPVVSQGEGKRVSKVPCGTVRLSRSPFHRTSRVVSCYTDVSGRYRGVPGCGGVEGRLRRAAGVPSVNRERERGGRSAEGEGSRGPRTHAIFFCVNLAFRSVGFFLFPGCRAYRRISGGRRLQVDSAGFLPPLASSSPSIFLHGRALVSMETGLRGKLPNGSLRSLHVYFCHVEPRLLLRRLSTLPRVQNFARVDGV